MIKFEMSFNGKKGKAGEREIKKHFKELPDKLLKRAELLLNKNKLKKMSFQEKYDSIKKREAESNKSRLINKIQSEDQELNDSLLEHIKIWDLDYSLGDLKIAILQDDLLMSKFSVDPMKNQLGIQSVHEFLNSHELGVSKSPLKGGGVVKFFGKPVHLRHNDRNIFCFIANGFGGAQNTVEKNAKILINGLNDIRSNVGFYLLFGGTKFDSEAIDSLKELVSRDNIKVMTPDQYISNI